MILIAALIIIFAVFYKATPIQFRATDYGFEYDNEIKSAVKIDAYSNNERLDFSKANKTINLGSSIRFGVNFNEKIDYATFSLQSESHLEKKSELVYRYELKPIVTIDPIGNIKYLKHWIVYDFTDLKGKNPNSTITEREENGFVIIKVINATNLDPTITEETQGEFDDGIFANTTSDSHGNGSIRLQNDAVFTANFNVNGTLSGNVTESSNNTYIGEIYNGVLWNQSGKYGSAYTLDGTTGSIRYHIPSTALTFSNKIYTVSIWIRPEGTPQNSMPIMRSDNFNGWGIYIDLNGRISSFQEGFQNCDSASSAITWNAWNHVVMVGRGSSLDIYVDGVNVCNTNTTYSLSSSLANDLFIGHDKNGNNKFKGTLDEIIIWNRSLSENEILSINNSQQSGKYYSSGTYKSSTLIANTNVTWNNATARISVNSSSVDTTQLVGWWKFNETTGLTVYDYSGYGNNGTMNNTPTRSENSIADYAMKFDGIDDYIDIPDSGSLDILGNITVAAWIYHKSYISANDNFGQCHQGIISKGVLGDQTYKLMFTSCNSTGYFVYFEVNSGGTAYGPQNFISPELNNWHYIVGTYNGSDVVTYLDGIKIGNHTIGYKVLDANSETLKIGRDSYASSGRISNGTIDEVMIWNRSLSATEIFENYRRGLTRQGGNITLNISTSKDNATWYTYSVLLQDNITTSLSVASGQYLNYTLNFNTNDTAATPYLFNISFDYFGVQITGNLSTNLTNPDSKVYVSGYVNLTDGTPLADQPVFVYADGIRLNTTNETSPQTVVLNGYYNGTLDYTGQNVVISDVTVNSYNGTPNTGWLTIIANTITINGTLNASGRGYGGGGGGGAGGSCGGDTVQKGTGGNATGPTLGGEAGGNAVAWNAAGNGGRGGGYGGGGGGAGAISCNIIGVGSSGGGNGSIYSSGTPDLYDGGAGGGGSGNGSQASNGVNLTAGSGVAGGGNGGSGGDGSASNDGAGGGGGGAGAFGGAGGAGQGASAGSAGSKGGYRSAGANGDTSTNLTAYMGSGGGGGGGSKYQSGISGYAGGKAGGSPNTAGGGGGGGSPGGGAITLIASVKIIVNGTISANGLGNANLNGGYGAGGGIALQAPTINITNSNNLRTLGGIEDGTGSATNGGTIKLFYYNITNNASASNAGRVFTFYNSSMSNCVTNASGFYNCSFIISTNGTYTIVVNTTYLDTHDSVQTSLTVGSVPASISVNNVNVSAGTNVTSTRYAWASWNYSNGNQNGSVYTWFINGTEAWKESSLLSYWRLDGNALDSSDYGNNGTINGPTNLSNGGITKGAYSFDGVNDYINVSNQAVRGLSAMTISVWVKIESSVVNIIFENRAGVDSDPSFEDAAGLSPAFWVANSGGASFGTLEQNKWYHLTGTIDGSRMKSYTNGILVTDISFTSSVSTAVGNMYLGSREGTSLFFNGDIDEFKIWNRSLTAAEVMSEYQQMKYGQTEKNWNSTLAGSSAHDVPRLLYHFDENTGNETKDYFGTTTGVLTGRVNWTDGLFGSIALLFNDTLGAQFVNVSFIQKMNITNAITIEAWIKPIGYNPSRGYMISKPIDNNADSWSISITDTGKLSFVLSNETNSSGDDIQSVTTLNNYTWYHVAAVWNGTTQSLYINGSLDADGFEKQGTINITDSNIIIGNSWQLSSEFNGTIEEVAIYSRALSESEINQSYLRGFPHFGYNTSSLLSGSNISVLIEPSNGTEFGNALMSANRSVSIHTINSKPNVATPTLSPATAYKYNTINATTTPIDNESTLLDVTFQWYKNGQSIYNLTASNQNNNSASTAILTNGNYSRFDNISACVYADDGQNISNTACSVNITIQNSAPDAYVNISQPITKNRYGWFAWNYTDNDTDLQNGTVYTWFINGTEAWKDPSLVGYWKLDGNALDSANNNHGTIQNGAVNASKGGIIKGAYSFDGINDHINISSTAQLNIIDNISISVWFKAVTGGAIVAKPATNIASQNTPYSLGINDSGFVIFNISNSTQTFHSQYQTTMNKWHNAIGTYNGSVMSLYIDGVLANYTVASGQINTSTRPFFIGGVAIPPLGVLFTLEGDIDEVKLWNRSLSSIEAMQEYHQMKYGQTEKDWNASTTGGTPAHDVPRLMYHIDEGFGNQTIDFFGNTVGTMIGSPDWTNGQFGSKALLFDGTNNQAVNVSYNQNMNISNAITIEAWIKPRGVNPSRGFIVQKPILTASDSAFLNIKNFTLGSFANTTNDINGNGSVRLNADAVLIMNFDVNGTISGNVTDISNNRNDGTLTNGPFWNMSNGKYGSAYVFDGVDDFLNVSDSSSLHLGPSITLSFWIKINSYPGANQIMIMKNTAGSSTTGFIAYINTTGTIRFCNPNNCGESATIETNEWTHIAFEQTGNVVKIYLNGLLNSTTDTGSAFDGIDSDNLYISSRRGGTEFFTGMLDEIKIYNRSLSAAEILVLNNSHQNGKYYSSGTYKNQLFNESANVTWVSVTPSIAINGDIDNFDNSRLVGWWKFNETTGLTAYDYSGYGNNGTMVNNIARSEDSIHDYAMKFDGSNDHVSIADSPSLNPANMTMMMWAKFNSLPYTSQIALNKEGSYRLLAGDVDGSYASIRYATSSVAWGAGTVVGSTLLETNRWYHVAAAFNGTTWIIYLNGLQDGISNIAEGTISSSGGSLYLGTYEGSSYLFNGKMDEVMLFNRSLSQTEIYNIYKNQLSSKSTGNVSIQFQTSRDNATWTELTSPVILEDNTVIGISSDDGRYINYTLTFNTNDTSSTPYVINMTFKTTDEYSNSNSWFLSHMESGAIAFGTTNQTSKSNRDLPGTIILRNNTWYHVAATWDGTTQRIYINGTLDGEREFLGTLNLTTLPMYIGGSDILSNGFNGTIDEIAIYSRALSDIEINQSYMRGFPHFGYNTSSLLRNSNISVLVEPNDGYSFGSFMTLNRTINNTVPEATNVLIIPTSAYKTTLFNVSVVVTDNDNDTMNVTFKWYNNSVNILNNTVVGAINGANVTNTISNSLYIHFGNISVEIQVEDAFTNGTWLNTSIVQIQNTLPEILSIGLAPSTANKTTVFNASIIAIDNDTDSITVNFSWIVNGIRINNSVNSVQNGTNVTNTIGVGNYSHFDNVTVEIIIFDGYGTSASVNSSTVQIGNTNPEITTPIISPSSPNANSILNASVVTRDEDLDSMTIEFRWIKNGNIYVYNSTISGQTNGTNVTSLLTNGNFSGEDNISVEVYAHDLYSNSTFKNSSSVFINTTFNKNPNVATPTLSPTTAYETSVINATTTPIDNESALMNVTFRWYKNGQSVYNFTSLNQNNNSESTALLLTGNFSHFDNVSVCVFANDGELNSTVQCSLNKTIQNTIPEINEVALIKWPAFYMLSLNASAVAIDNDTDILTINFTWIINGTIRVANISVSSVQNGTNTSNTIANTNYNIGDNITVEIKVFDGYNTSVYINTTTLEILPNIPYVTTPVIDPQDAYTDSIFTATSGIYHPTSQLLNVTFKWYKNNIYAVNNTIINHPANTTASATLVYTNFTRYDNISVEVYAFDGTDYSTFKNSTPVTVQRRITRASFRLDFSINGVSNDIAYADTNSTGFFIDIENKFGCVQDSSAAYGIVFSGDTFVNLNLSNSQIAGNSYNMKMTQNEQGDKFILPITTGGCDSIRSKMPIIKSNKILTQPFYQLPTTGTYPIELIRNYEIDIVGSIDRSGQFIIELENNGTNQIIARVK